MPEAENLLPHASRDDIDKDYGVGWEKYPAAYNGIQVPVRNRSPSRCRIHSLSGGLQCEVEFGDPIEALSGTPNLLRGILTHRVYAASTP